MGKRKHVSKDRLLKKLKRLERRICRASESDSDEDAAEPTTQVVDIVDESPQEVVEEETEGGGERDNLPVEEADVTVEPLPESLINILGDDGINSQDTQTCLPELAIRWENILKSGLKKEYKESLELKYKALLANCPSLSPPKINIEVKAAVADSALKRDTKITLEQSQIAACITALGLAMTSIIKNNPHAEGLEHLSNSARLLCDLHHNISVNRRGLLVSGLNKDIKEMTENIPVDGLILGNDFTEKLKANQAAKKLSSQSLKTPVPSKMQKPKQNLNYRGPPRQQPPARQSGQKGWPQKHRRNYNYNHQRFTKKQPPPRK